MDKYFVFFMLFSFFQIVTFASVHYIIMKMDRITRLNEETVKFIYDNYNKSLKKKL